MASLCATITAPQYVSHHFQSEIRFLGLASSPAFVREPEGNGCAERFIRVLKENLLWVRRFDTLEELRLALLAFKQTYNQSWIIERHGYKTPAQVRAEQVGQLPMAVEAQIDVPQLWTGTNALYPPCAYANSPAMRYGAPATLGSTLPSRVAV